MKVLIAGIDGYLGWPLALELLRRNHTVAGVDCYLRRDMVAEVGSKSAIPILEMPQRVEALKKKGASITFKCVDVCNYDAVRDIFNRFCPDAVVHLAEIPSAPYSMIDVAHCTKTQVNNIVGTLNILHAIRDVSPNTHLLKLGTMGEYGTPNLDIPEGFFEIEWKGRTDILPFPRQAGSWYHQSKVHDSHNILMACRLWGLKSTDVMQGVVYGTRTDAMEGDECATRFDFDQCFGTSINRFCIQAILRMPITPYGHGGQVRGFLPLRDSIGCMVLSLENPPEKGEYRVLNQFEDVYTIASLATRVKNVANSFGLDAIVEPIENPRHEVENHYYNPARNKLLEMGYKPSRAMDTDIKLMLSDLLRHEDRIKELSAVVLPDIRWDGTRRPSRRRQ